jgi:NAD-dependent deacetylase
MSESPHPHLELLLSDARRILLFTGAGISTGSIPDFRGPQGVWKRGSPSITRISSVRRRPVSSTGTSS